MFPRSACVAVKSALLMIPDCDSVKQLLAVVSVEQTGGNLIPHSRSRQMFAQRWARFCSRFLPVEGSFVFALSPGAVGL